MEILQTSTRDQHDELQKTGKMLEDLRRTSDRDLIKNEYQNNPIDWRNISEISVRIFEN